MRLKLDGNLAAHAVSAVLAAGFEVDTVIDEGAGWGTHVNISNPCLLIGIVVPPPEGRAEARGADQG